jgi:hypothetical protein
LAGFSQIWYKWLKAILLLGITITGLWVYGHYDPAKLLFPKCPFFLVTGFECPGCGSQRAIHQILHGNISKAFFYNPLMVLFIPYMLTGWLFEVIPVSKNVLKWRKRLFGIKAIYIILSLIIIFWFVRNII